jgi:hypothetical protein
MYAKTDEGPTHAYLLLKLTMEYLLHWCMQYQYDTHFLITAQHSVKVNVDVLTDNFSGISFTTRLRSKACPNSVQNYLNSKRLVTVDRNTAYTIMYTEYVARVPSISCRSSCGYIQVY